MTPDLAGASLAPVPFSQLPGWAEADLQSAWRAFRRGAEAIVNATAPLRPARLPFRDLEGVARRATEAPEEWDAASARGFFEAHFSAFAIAPADGACGFVTGYYEPVVPGTRQQTAASQAPILPRPTDLVTFPAEAPPVPDLAGLSAARRCADGGLEPYADRAKLEALAVTPDAQPVIWLRDWTEVFLIQVQGSARVRLPDGQEIRLVYAGRNGLPYTSIGRILIETGAVEPDAMSLDALKTWLRHEGQALGDRGRTLMQQNRSYIFFRGEPVTADDRSGAIGGAGVALTAGDSIAVDRSIWCYGLPFWVDAKAAIPGFGPETLKKLFVAQDTGSAILGAARADLFVGSGDAAGRDAGSIRHSADFTVLLPRAA